MTTKCTYICYGSQTGNSECIAARMFQKCQDEEIPAQLHNLNAVKEMNLVEIAEHVIIVCSTTGNGDCPENADKWWRFVKLRSTAKNLFENLPFAVLALGDTNYDKFCHMGKSIDKRMHELGGRRISPLCCADEVSGLEETVEAWTGRVLNILKESQNKKVASVACSIASETNNADNSEVQVNADEVSAAEVRSGAISCEDDNVIPHGISTVAKIAESLGIGHAEWRALLDSFDVPSSKVATTEYAKPSLNGVFRPAEDNSQVNVIPTPVPTMPSASSHSNLEDAKSKRKSPIPVMAEAWCASNTFSSNILMAKWLTSDNDDESSNIYPWGSTRRVLEMQLSIQGSGIAYQPGDSIGICCPNAEPLVKIIVTRLQQLYEDPSLSLTTNLETSLFAGSKFHCPTQITLGEFLLFRCDLMGVPKKAVVTKLANCCSDRDDKLTLLALASKGESGKHLWKTFLEAQHVCIGELLFMFTSCRPTIPQLIEMLIPMPPRYYSIASSPLEHPNSVRIAFSIVRYTCSISPVVSSATSTEPVPSVIRRSGLCTSYLEKLVAPILCESNLSTSSFASLPPIRIFHKSTISFHLPGSVGHPLILIGPGTGVAPFIGFLEHRAHLERERVALVGDEDMCCGVWRGGFELEEKDLPSESNQVGEFIKSVCPGPVYLFYGCRSDSDYLFRDDLHQFLKNGTLSILDVAKSRIGPEKVYVTHRLLARGASVANLIIKDMAHVYICGDGNHMARDVNATIKNILIEYGGLTATQAEEMIVDMKQRRRYVLDIWS